MEYLVLPIGERLGRYLYQMCGIAGMITPETIYQEDIDKSLSLLTHRGPDAQGCRRFVFDNRNAVFLHRRLSILDLSAEANQPFVDNHTVLVYNGEIYNFLDLKSELARQGHTFRTSSDTEVILKLYQREGIDCVKKLRGMFAFALLDEKEQTIYLVRDRMGQKPLYYYVRKDTFSFASTIYGLLAFRNVKSAIDLRKLNTYFTFNYNLSSDESLLENIYKLPPASILRIRGRNLQTSRYWHINYTPKLDVPLPEALQKTEELIKESTRYRLVSDVPLGFFLSGGIDSSLLVAMASQMDQRVKTFSIGFKDKDFSELPFAKKVAQAYGTDHHEFVIEPDIVTSLEKIVHQLDEPMADPSSLPVYYLAEQTRRHVTVALNGDGGDELFAGYEKYLGELYIHKVKQLPRAVRKTLLRLISSKKANNSRTSSIRRLRWLLKNSLQEDSYYSSSISFSHEEKKSLFSQEFFESHAEEKNYFENVEEDEIIDRLMKIDCLGYLPEDLLVKVDRMTMAHSLEGRSPFLDHVLIDFVTKLRSNIKLKNNKLKFLLREIASKYLPKDIVDRKKQGFGLPLNRWFREELKTYFRDTMESGKLVSDNILSHDGIDRFYQDHLTHRENNGRKLFTLLSGEIWYRNMRQLV